MTVFAVVKNNRRDPPGYQSSWAYRELFHGDEISKGSRYGERPYDPMCLIRSMRVRPGVFIPGISLVVSERIANQLSAMVAGRIDLNPCIWHKVYDYSLEEPDVWELINRHRQSGGPEYDDWRNPMLRDPSAEEQAIQYFEVVPPLLNRISQAYECGAALELPQQSHYVNKPPVKTCAALHEAHPIVYHHTYYLCAEVVYRILEPHVTNRHLFSVYEYRVDG